MPLTKYLTTSKESLATLPKIPYHLKEFMRSDDNLKAKSQSPMLRPSRKQNLVFSSFGKLLIILR